MKIRFGTFPQSVASPEALENMSPTANKAGHYSSGGDFYVRLITRPHQPNYTFSDGTPIKDNEVKYFKVEPLYWDVVADFGDCLLLVADKILYASCFYGSFKDRMVGRKTIYRNDWGDSDARKWLNDYFYRKAFNGMDKRQLLDQKTDVDAGGFFHNLFAKQIITRSNVVFLSYEDACNFDFGYKDFKEKDERRQKAPTDFAKASGAFYSPIAGDGQGFGSWWLLSNGKNGATVLTVLKNGTIDMEGGVFNHTHHGFVPCVLIIKPTEEKLRDMIFDGNKSENTDPEHHVDGATEDAVMPDGLYDSADETVSDEAVSDEAEAEEELVEEGAPTESDGGEEEAFSEEENDGIDGEE